MRLLHSTIIRVISIFSLFMNRQICDIILLRTAKEHFEKRVKIYMDNLKIGQYIQHLRKIAGMTQKELAEKLNISFQAVSKWENGDSLPDTGLLPQLCDVLGTTADKLLNGGSVAVVDRRLMPLSDVVTGFEYIEKIGELFGEDCTFFTGMIEGINNKMNIDLLSYLKVPSAREVMYAEVLIQGILSGRTVNMKEIEENFNNPAMVETIRDYVSKTDTPGTAE